MQHRCTAPLIITFSGGYTELTAYRLRVQQRQRLPGCRPPFLLIPGRKIIFIFKARFKFRRYDDFDRRSICVNMRKEQPSWQTKKRSRRKPTRQIHPNPQWTKTAILWRHPREEDLPIRPEAVARLNLPKMQTAIPCRLLREEDLPCRRMAAGLPDRLKRKKPLQGKRKHKKLPPRTSFGAGIPCQSINVVG